MKDQSSTDSTMISSQSLLITGGSFNYNVASTSKGFDLLAEKVATRALHASGEICDPARCHPDTRVAILTDLEEWAVAKHSHRIKWIRGSAGVGKTAIMRSIAEILEGRKLLLAGFFFWRTGDRCDTTEFLIPTLAYQIAISIPETRPHIARAIEDNPLIFKQTLEAQCRAMIVEPLIFSLQQKGPSIRHPRIFVIDGLDECRDVEKRCEALKVLHWTLKQIPMSIALLVSSRPENHIQKIFNTVLKDISSSRLLDTARNTNTDIKRFYASKFRDIRDHHPLKFYLSKTEWPAADDIATLVQRASGQFIYASTVVKFVAAAGKNPADQLKTVLESRGQAWESGLNPFLPLDVLYSTIFSTIDVEDIRATLRVIGVLLFPQKVTFSLAPPSFWENLLGLREGEIRRLLIGLEALVSVRDSDTEIRKMVHFYHASLADFLSDSRRSGVFFMDEGMVCEDLARRCIAHLYTTDDDIKQYIIHNMESVILRATPTMELYQAIDAVGKLCSTKSLVGGRSAMQPHFFKHVFPTLLNAIPRSNFPAKEVLHAVKFKDYCVLLEQVLPHYFQDERLIFLILARVSLDCDYWSVLHFDQFIDEICPLPLELKRIDEGALFLYCDYYWHDLRLFTETAQGVIAKMDEVAKWYSVAACYLLKLMNRNSGVYVEANHFIGVGNDAVAFSYIVSLLFPALSSRASKRSSLEHYLKHNTIAPDYWKNQKVKGAIDRYLSRDQEINDPAEKRESFKRTQSVQRKRTTSTRIPRALSHYHCQHSAKNSF